MGKQRAATDKTLYTREALLKSDLFSQYQKDFLAAVLCKPEYTIAEAEETVKDFFGKD